MIRNECGPPLYLAQGYIGSQEFLNLVVRVQQLIPVIV